MRIIKVEVLKKKKQWYVRAIHRNGKIAWRTETYCSKYAAINAASDLVHATYKMVVCD